MDKKREVQPAKPRAKKDAVKKIVAKTDVIGTMEAIETENVNKPRKKTPPANSTSNETSAERKKQLIR